MIYFMTIGVIVAYGLALYFLETKDHYRLSPDQTYRLKIIHFVGLVIALTIAFLYSNFGIGLRGLWTTRIVIIITLLTGFFLPTFGNKSNFRKPEKWYFNAFSLLPIFGLIFLMIPFLGAVVVFSTLGRLTSPAEKIYYEDDKFRVQSSFVGALGPPRIDVFEKHFIFEKHSKRFDFWATEIDSLKVRYDADSARVIAFSRYTLENKDSLVTETMSFKP